MLAIGETIDYRHGGVAGQGLDCAVGKGPRQNQVGIAAEHLSHILHGLPFAQTDFPPGEVDSMAAELIHRHIEANPGA